MNYIISRYSYLFKSNSGEYLIYNSARNFFIEINEILYSNLRPYTKGGIIDISNFDENVLQILLKNKIFVNREDDDNYFYEQKMKAYMSFFSQKTLSMTVVPTTGCNFGCPYCFESHKKAIIMSEKIIDDLIVFINQHERAEFLNLTWYGGEPLMAFKAIKKIMSEIKLKTNVKLTSHDLVTNGYLFDETVCAFFKENPLDSIQITLDGNEESHNQKRKLKRTGKATYQKIIENINLILTVLPNTMLSIRVNIDMENKNEFYEVYQALMTKYQDKNLYIYPGYIRYDNESKNRLSCLSLQQKDMAGFYFALNDYNDINIKFYPRSVKKGCTANCVNSYIIGPLGEIYKCWNDVGNENKIVGNINNDTISNLALLSKYSVGSSCFEDEKCKKCFFLPICSGGCPWYRMRNLFEGGKFNLCTVYNNKSILKKCLEIHYNDQNKKIKYHLSFS